MALRLSRDLSQQNTATSEETNQNGFSVTGVDGKSYNLEEIEKLRNRQGTSALFVEVKEKPTENLGNLNSVSNTGDLLVGTNIQRKTTTSDDYRTYLIDNKSGFTRSNQYYIPEITNKHPIVNWNDETIDTIHTEITENSIVYSKLYELEKVYDTVNNNFSILLSDENKPILESVTGVKHIVDNFDDSLLNKNVVNNFDSPDDSTIPTTAAIDEIYLRKASITIDTVDIRNYLWEGQTTQDAIYTNGGIFTENEEGYYTATLTDDFMFVRNSDGDNMYSLVIS